MTILVALIAFVVIFGLVAFAAGFASRQLLKREVIDRHAALEEILDTGHVPTLWRQGDGRSNSVAADHGSAGPIRQDDLKQLERLRSYVRTTRLVESEEVRQETLDRLAEVRAHWERGEPGPNDRSAR